MKEYKMLELTVCGKIQNMYVPLLGDSFTFANIFAKGQTLLFPNSYYRTDSRPQLYKKRIYSLNTKHICLVREAQKTGEVMRKNSQNVNTK